MDTIPTKITELRNNIFLDKYNIVGIPIYPKQYFD